MSIIVLHLILRTVAKAAKQFVIVGIGGNALLLPRTGNQTIKRGGKTPVSQSQCPYEPVPRAIVVYPAPLCPPLVVIPTRRILIPRCRFGILHTTYCALDINIQPLAIPPRPLVSGRVQGSGGGGFC